MHNVMQGVRIIEVAQWTFVPAAGAVLSDWGADVIKVEHPVHGDAQRGLIRMGLVANTGNVNFIMEHANRGKRSIGIDIASADGLEVLYELVRSADVFLTNFLPDARERLKIDLEHIRAQNPNIIYVRGTGNGNKGPEREKGGYDGATYWCRGGSADSMTPPGAPHPAPMPAPAYGDSIGGMTIAGGIAGALFGRERTGEPSVVDVSLLSVGSWAMGAAIDAAMLTGQPWSVAEGGRGIINPLVGSYPTQDGRFINLTMLQGFAYFADLCSCIGHPELVDDPRFDSAEKFGENSAECAEILQGIFKTATLAEWRERLTAMEGGGVWSPVQNPVEMPDDPQIAANGYIVPVEAGDGTTFRLVANPVQFDEQPPALTRHPEHGEHTETILLDLGVEWERIAQLKESGAIS